MFRQKGLPRLALEMIGLGHDLCTGTTIMVARFLFFLGNRFARQRMARILAIGGQRQGQHIQRARHAVRIVQVRRIDPCLGQMGDGPQHALAGKGQGGLHMLRNGQRGVAHQGRKSVHGISGGACGLG